MLLCKTEARMVISTIILGVGKPKKIMHLQHEKPKSVQNILVRFHSVLGNEIFHQLLNGVSA